MTLRGQLAERVRRAKSAMRTLEGRAEPSDTIFVNEAASQRPPKLGHGKTDPTVLGFEDLTPVTAMKLSSKSL